MNQQQQPQEHQDTVICKVFQKWQEYLASTNTEPMPRHECSSETCDFINEENVYICPTTGELHCCGPDCDSVTMRQDNMVCTIRKRILPQLLRSPIITSEDYNTSRWTHGQATNSARETSFRLAAAAKTSHSLDTLCLDPNVLCLNIAFCANTFNTFSASRESNTAGISHSHGFGSSQDVAVCWDSTSPSLSVSSSPLSLYNSANSSVPSSPLSAHLPGKSAHPSEMRGSIHNDPNKFIHLVLPDGLFSKKGTKRKASNKHKQPHDTDTDASGKQVSTNTCLDSVLAHKRAKTESITNASTTTIHENLATVQNAKNILCRLLVSRERLELQPSYDTVDMVDVQHSSRHLQTTTTTPKTLLQVLSINTLVNTINQRPPSSRRVISCANDAVLQANAKEMDEIARICVTTYQQHIKTGNLSLLSKYSFDYHCVVVLYMMIDGYQTFNLSDPRKHLSILPKVPFLAQYLPERVDLQRFGYEYSRVNDTQHLFRKFRQLL